ncbi:pyridoxal phosphate-dependent transferase [Phaeosphaeriaceae sp. PMI808]|nr:pyridoxal phosphate-dependent transferase [Phaeosphaeriaceae sp. PMI808]
MEDLSSRMQKPVSCILPKIEATISERTSGNPKIDLSTAENWLLRPEILKICKETVQNKLTLAHLSYPSGFGGDPELQTALATFFNKYFDPVSEVTTRDISVTPGASNCLDSLLFSICEVDDSILVVAPYWSGFDFHFTLRPGINIIPVYTESCNRLDDPGHLLSDSLVPALENALQRCEDASRVKALVISNPHNPFAQCYPEYVLSEAIHWCADHNLRYISDEVYALSDFSRHPATPFTSALALHLEPEKTPLMSIIWSTSKDLGSSGFRMGTQIYKPGPSLLTTSLGLLSTTQLPTVSMLLTHALLTSDSFDTLVVQNRQRLRRHYSVVTKRLQRWGVPFIPATSGPYLLQAKISNSESGDVAQILRSKAGVLVAPGSAFHMQGQGSNSGWVRITFAVPMDVLEDGLNHIESALELGKSKLTNGDVM